MAFDKPVVVIDNGSYMTKAGFACDNHPVSMFRTSVGRPEYLHGNYGKEPYDVYIGDDAVARIQGLELSSPVQNGKIVHWDNMERIWHHIFYRELKVAPEDRSVILAVSLTTPLKDKVKCCEVLFETLNIPGLCIQSQSALSLYGSGFATGISVDLGYDTADIVPIYEGGPISYAHKQTNYSGRDMLNFINVSLQSRGFKMENSLNTLEDIKKMVYVTRNVSMPRKNYRKIYKLPDGGDIEVTDELFMAGENVFSPQLVKDCVPCKEYMTPLHEAVVTCASKCDPDLRSDLYSAVVLCGGMAMMTGLRDRLEIEVENLARRPVNVLSSTEAYAVAWLGGATFAGMPVARQMWVSKRQFEENGVRIVRNKFV